MNLFKDILTAKKEVFPIGFSWAIQDDLIYFHLEPLFKVWRKIYINKENRFLTVTAAHEFLKGQPGFKKLSINKKINRQVYRCVVFDLQTAPDDLRKIIITESPKCLLARG